MAVTIKQIAELAGVAPTTVSLVLRDSRKVGAETKARVLRIIEEMDYYPNNSGKLLKQGRTDAVAVVSSLFSSIFKMEFMEGIERAVYGSPYQLRHFFSDANAEAAKCKEVLYGNMADAAIVMNALVSPEFLQKFKAARKALVLVEDVVEGYPGVRFDNFRAGYEAVSYLARRGRRRIAIALGIKAYMGHCFVDERLRGYITGLRELGLDYSEIIDLPAYDLAGGRLVFERVMDKGAKPDAIFFASGDVTAASFLKEARAKGLRVPEDMAVLGCDDSIIAQSTTLGLSSIRQPALDMGKAAFDLAIKLLDGDAEAFSKTITFPPEIIVREST